MAARLKGGHSMSIANLARELDWFLADGRPYKSRVQRALKRLKADKLVRCEFLVAPHSSTIMRRSVTRKVSTWSRTAFTDQFSDMANSTPPPAVQPTAFTVVGG